MMHGGGSKTPSTVTPNLTLSPFSCVFVCDGRSSDEAGGPRANTHVCEECLSFSPFIFFPFFFFFFSFFSLDFLELGDSPKAHTIDKGKQEKGQGGLN